MAFKMAEGSLFAMLLRSSWWYSASIGLLILGIGFVVAGGQYLILGIAGSLPFFGIAGYAGHKQFKLPSKKRIIEVAQQAQEMRSGQIAEIVLRRYVENGYESSTFRGNGADIELTRGYRKVLLCSKRFKVGNTGVEPLKQLVAAGEKVEATSYLYVALGGISAAARSYANQNNIELIQAGELAAFFDGQVQIE